MNYLITGANSFTGRHLVGFLDEAAEGNITASGREQTAPAGIRVPYERCDVAKAGELDALVGACRPERIIHLAACSDESDPDTLIQTNLEGTYHLLDACHRHGAGTGGILVVGSAAGFGEMDRDEAPLAEDRLAAPSSFYGWSREAQLELARTAARKWGLPLFLCRPFNLIGPGLGEAYAPTRLARQLIAQERRNGNVFPLPNGEVERDFVDVRDAVGAYHAILTRGRPGVPYHVASGRTTTLRELVELLARAIGVEGSLRLVSEGGSDFANRSGIGRSHADIARIHRDTGWQPSIPLERSVADLVEGLLDPNDAGLS